MRKEELAPKRMQSGCNTLIRIAQEAVVPSCGMESECSPGQVCLIYFPGGSEWYKQLPNTQALISSRSLTLSLLGPPGAAAAPGAPRIPRARACGCPLAFPGLASLGACCWAWASPAGGAPLPRRRRRLPLPLQPASLHPSALPHRVGAPSRRRRPSCSASCWASASLCVGPAPPAGRGSSGASGGRLWSPGPLLGLSP